MVIRVSDIVFVIYQNASSAGAIAGFAIALVCTWKYLKTPSRQRNKINDKRDAPSSSNAPPMETTAEGTSTAIAKSLTQPIQRGVVIRDSPPATQVCNEPFCSSPTFILVYSEQK